ncbi:MAG: phosphoribosylglycinamide formyltransferase [Armatimonadota bacterium]
MKQPPINIAVMVSGQSRGSNMQAIINGCKDGEINGKVVCVIGVRDSAPAIERAKLQNINTLIINPSEYPSQDEYDEKLISALSDYNIDLICLAGYMRPLGIKIIRTYRNKIMNVHPSLIPSFCGKGMYGHHVHEAAIKRGVKVSGATVHFVNEEYDEGPIILQTVVNIDDNDNAETLAAKVLNVEHSTYVKAISLFADNKLVIIGNKVIFK